jgi:hypothetical protein
MALRVLVVLTESDPGRFTASFVADQTGLYTVRRISVGSATDPCTLIEIMTTSPSGIGCALVAPSTGFIRVFCEIGQEIKECLGLADKEPHVCQEFDHALGDVFCFGRANNGARRQISTDEGAWLRHD